MKYISVCLGVGSMRYRKTDAYDKKILDIIKNAPDNYEELGCISGSKISKATLPAILTMIGVDGTYDDYTKRKFKRGHDVEALFVEMLTGIAPNKQKDGEWQEPKPNYPITGKFMLQAQPKAGYRGMTNSVDLLEDIGHSMIVHEIKSATKLAFDKVNGSGRSRKNENPEPHEHYAIQVASYSLSDWGKPVANAILHYVNADDYRVVSFFVNYKEFKPMIDENIDAIQKAFKNKIFPIFEPKNEWEKVKKYLGWVEEWAGLNSLQIAEKIRVQHPEAYELFMKTTIDDTGKHIK